MKSVSNGHYLPFESCQVTEKGLAAKLCRGKNILRLPCLNAISFQSYLWDSMFYALATPAMMKIRELGGNSLIWIPAFAGMTLYAIRHSREGGNPVWLSMG
jgi:hypothetical protein